MNSVNISDDNNDLIHELGMYDNYQEIKRYLQEEIANQIVYVVGPPANNLFHIYILGNDEDGDWAGVLIETGLLS
jgi:hypothetical protein